MSTRPDQVLLRGLQTTSLTPPVQPPAPSVRSVAAKPAAASDASNPPRQQEQPLRQAYQSASSQRSAAASTISLPPRPDGSDPAHDVRQRNTQSGDRQPVASGNVRSAQGHDLESQRLIPRRDSSDSSNDDPCSLSSLLCCSSANVLTFFGSAMFGAGGALLVATEYLNGQGFKDVAATDIIGMQRGISYGICACGACAMCLAARGALIRMMRGQ